jgi:glycosyltransferase involved in cell wall biosynthesis
MKVLMFGWEFPPFITGGLGTACYGLTRAMTGLGIEVIFVLPRPVDASHSSHVTLLTPEGVASGSRRAPTDRIRILGTQPKDSAYARPEDFAGHERDPARKADPEALAAARGGKKLGSVVRSHYGGNLFEEVDRYARMASRITRPYAFDVIHCHDWMTYRAGITVARQTGVPLVVHVHSTEFDRSGEHVNQRIYDVEREGMHVADHVIAVSHLTRNVIINRYGVPPSKVSVVYNAIDMNGRSGGPAPPRIRGDEKIVLFMGRITMQKGPEFFVAAAKQVLQQMDNVRFVIAGSGDMAGRVVEMAAREGIGRKVLFTGFLRGREVERVFRSADLFVMPSVSEPFGLVPLEAMSYGVPVIISKQSGVAEILHNVLKVDFWDVREMANKIVAVLRQPTLHSWLRDRGAEELACIRWENSARDCRRVYERVLSGR